MRKLFSAVLLAASLLFGGVALAVNPYHTPASTNNTSKHCRFATPLYDSYDSSGVMWYAPKSRFLNLAFQSIIESFDTDCHKLSATPHFDCSGYTGNDHEGITGVENPSVLSANSEVILVQTENGGGICRLDGDDIIDGGPITVLENFDWPTGDADCGSGFPSNGGSEGITFVPDHAADGVCRYNGYLLAQDQTAGYIYKYCIHLTNPTLDCISRTARPACNSSTESASLEYDWDNANVYFGSDGTVGEVQAGHGDATCVMAYSDLTTVIKTILDPNTGSERPQNIYCTAAATPYSCCTGAGTGTCLSNQFEGISFGGGKFAMTDDGTNGADDNYNGLWLFNDTYDNVSEVLTTGIRYAATTNSCAHMAGITCSTASTCGSEGLTAGKFPNTANAPCCEVQRAHDVAAIGDTIEVHGTTGAPFQNTGCTGGTGCTTGTATDPGSGNWVSPAIPFGVRLRRVCTGVTGPNNGAVCNRDSFGPGPLGHDCDGTLSSGNGRCNGTKIARIQAASGETPMFDLQTTRYGGVWVDSDNTTVDGMNCKNQAAFGDTVRMGCVTAARYDNQAAVNNYTLMNSSTDVTSTNSTLSGLVGFNTRATGTVNVHHNTVTGKFSTGFITENVGDGTTFYDLHHNTLTGNRTENAETCFIMEHWGGTAYVHDNVCNTTGGGTSAMAHRFAFPRDDEGTIYFYNNFARSNWSDSGYGAFYFQDDDDQQNENIWVFDNTIEGYTNGIFWQANSYRAHIRNNIFKTTNAVRLQGCKPGCCVCLNGIGSPGDSSDLSCNSYSNILVEQNGWPLPIGVSPNLNVHSNCALAGVCVGETDSNGIENTPCTVATQVADCVSDVCRAGTTHHLTASSGACTNTGCNDPTGSGPNTCFFPGGKSCLPDIDNDIRPQGAGFDIGYDELAVGGQTCGNGVIDTPGEVCDGTLHGTATCTSLGYSPFFTGTPQCASDCLSFNQGTCVVGRKQTRPHTISTP